jgi:hypothetical protein
MEALLSLPFAWRWMRWGEKSTTAKNGRLLCESFLVVGQRDLSGLQSQQNLRLKHSFDKSTGIHRFSVYHKRRLLGYLPLPEAQKLAENQSNGHQLQARICWYAPDAPYWEKLKVRISAI